MISKCPIGTPIQGRAWYPNGPRIAQTLFNFKHQWVIVNGIKKCLSCNIEYKKARIKKETECP